MKNAMLRNFLKWAHCFHKSVSTQCLIRTLFQEDIQVDGYPNLRMIKKAVAIVPYWDYYVGHMRIIALSTLKAFWEENPEYQDAKEPTLAWYRHALQADWSSPAGVKQDFGNASILKDGRVVFNIAGNKYRLVVWINYAYRVVYIRFIGTHMQYDKINVQTI